MNILVVDDSSFFLKVIREELAIANYNVETASKTQTAKTILQEKEFDLLILDIEMPDRNGLDLLEELINENIIQLGQTKCLFMSAHDKYEYRARGFELGALDFISKSLSTGEIQLRVDKILRPNSRFHGKTVLVIDDDKHISRVISFVLMEEGIEVLKAYSYEDALNVAEGREKEINAIILDKYLEERDGLDLIKDLKKNHNINVPFIIVSAESNHQEIVNFFSAGANDYLIKPFLKEELKVRVHNILDKDTESKTNQKIISRFKKLQKMKDEILGVCSHDIKTPIQGIIGLTELIKESANLNDDQIESLDMIDSSANFLLEMVNNILNLRRIEEDDEISSNNVYVKDLFDNVNHSMRPYSTLKNIDLKFKILAAKDVQVKIDLNSFLRLFNNILSNSIKFSSYGRPVDITYFSEDKFHIFTIQDYGKGLTHSELDFLSQATDKLYSQEGHSGEKGTGLGTKIIKNIVKNHNGTVEFKSDGPQKGTSVIIKLPIAE